MEFRKGDKLLLIWLTFRNEEKRLLATAAPLPYSKSRMWWQPVAGMGEESGNNCVSIIIKKMWRAEITNTGFIIHIWHNHPSVKIPSRTPQPNGDDLAFRENLRRTVEVIGRVAAGTLTEERKGASLVWDKITFSMCPTSKPAYNE